MSLVAENADGEEDEDGNAGDSSGQSKSFLQQIMESHKSCTSGSETSQVNKHDVSCFLDLLENSRGSSAMSKDEASNRTIGANSMLSKQDLYEGQIQ